MRAARLNELGKPLAIEQLEMPPTHPSGIVVRVLSSHMMSYTGEVFSGHAARLTPPVPYTPGLCAVGVVESVADDVTGLEPGMHVFCNPHVSVASGDGEPEQILIGWFGLTPGAAPLLARWKNGSFAEFAAYPAGCATPVSADLAADHGRLATLNVLTVAYGALLRGGFAPGMTVIVNGATGNIGACAVLLCLALGAARVIALGRDQAVLDKLAALDRDRVSAVRLSGDVETDHKAVQAAVPLIELCVDASAAPDPMSTLAALNALRTRGTAVWVGGVRAEIPVSYMAVLRKELSIVGSYMYGPDVPAALVRLIETGVLDLSAFDIHAYPLDDINTAIAHAPDCKGLSAVVVQP